MKKSLCKNVRKSKKNTAEMPKITFNTIYNLRRKAANPIINTKNDESVPGEFKSPERKGRDNRTNTELINSQTFHNNKIAN